MVPQKWMIYNGNAYLKWMIWRENPLFSEKKTYCLKPPPRTLQPRGEARRFFSVKLNPRPKAHRVEADPIRGVFRQVLETKNGNRSKGPWKPHGKTWQVLQNPPFSNRKCIDSNCTYMKHIKIIHSCTSVYQSHGSAMGNVSFDAFNQSPGNWKIVPQQWWVWEVRYLLLNLASWVIHVKFHWKLVWECHQPMEHDLNKTPLMPSTNPKHPTSPTIGLAPIFPVTGQPEFLSSPALSVAAPALRLVLGVGLKLPSSDARARLRPRWSRRRVVQCGEGKISTDSWANWYIYLHKWLVS